MSKGDNYGVTIKALVVVVYYKLNCGRFMTVFQLAWEVKWSNIIIKTDCVLTINEIHKNHKRHSNRDLILQIQELCRCEWKVIIKQVLRGEFDG